MKKTFKSIIAVTLCFIMLIGTIAIGGDGFANVLETISIKASAADTTSGTCGDNLTWELRNGTLTIEGSGNMTDFEMIQNETGSGLIPNTPWYSSRDSIKAVVISNEITSIGDYAFSFCQSISDVAISKSVTLIGEHSFDCCYGLTSVALPDSITDIGGFAFEHCTSLTTINIPEGITVINNSTFRDCISLKSIVIPDTVMSLEDHAFYASAITYITIPESVTTLGSMVFCDCDSLESVIIPDSVTKFGDYMFEFCDNLKSVVIGAGIRNLSSAFVECPALEIISVSKNNSLYDSRDNCNAVIETATDTLILGGRETVIPGSVKYIGSYGYSDITSLTVPEGVIGIKGSAFIHCRNLKSIYLPASTESIGYAAFYPVTKRYGEIIGCNLSDVYYAGNKSDRESINIEAENDTLVNATWHYNYYSEADIIPGNPASGQKTYSYKSTVTYTANIPEGGTAEWYLNDQLVSTGSSYTTPQMKSSYTVKVVITAADGTKTVDTENVTIKSGFFDKVVAFFVLLFNKSAYTYTQK